MIKKVAVEADNWHPAKRGYYAYLNHCKQIGDVSGSLFGQYVLVGSAAFSLAKVEKAES